MTTRTARRTYGVNRDRWMTLRDILVGTPGEFNPDSSTLRGRYIADGDVISFGQLAQSYVNEIRDSVVRYVIYSYDTPIAWRRIAEWSPDGSPVWEWVIPSEKYSATTSKHQGKVRTAISQMNTTVKEY